MKPKSFAINIKRNSFLEFNSSGPGVNPVKLTGDLLSKRINRKLTATLLKFMLTDELFLNYGGHLYEFRINTYNYNLTFL